MKKYVIFLALVLAMGCSGSSDNNNQSPALNLISSFQTGVAPQDVSGCYKLTYDVESSTCDTSVDSSTTVCITQNGATVESEGIPGVVSGNSFKLEGTASDTIQDCSYTANEVIVGTVDGNNISGAIDGDITASGNCSQLNIQTCSIVVTYSGTRTSSSSGDSDTSDTNTSGNTDDNGSTEGPTETPVSQVEAGAAHIETSAPLKGAASKGFLIFNK